MGPPPGPLEIDGRRVDVHYRDLATIDCEIGGTREGRFRIEPQARRGQR
jgi:hypothetical protein